jgi:hypothetical protein
LLDELGTRLAHQVEQGPEFMSPNVREAA